MSEATNMKGTVKSAARTTVSDAIDLYGQVRRSRKSGSTRAHERRIRPYYVVIIFRTKDRTVNNEHGSRLVRHHHPFVLGPWKWSPLSCHHRPYQAIRNLFYQL